MKIARVTATPLNIPVEFELPGELRSTNLSACLVDVETDDGLVGTGFTAITEEEVIATIVNEIAAPALVGEDPLATERLWDKLYWLLTPRGQTGYACHAMAAIDIALWDLKGKALGQPLWRLLGGARNRVPTYITFGFAFLDCDELVAMAEYWVAKGNRRLKMVVGHGALKRRDEPRPIAAVLAEDLRRVAAVRDAVGPEVELFVDANCNLEPFHAAWLAKRLEQYDITFFEEPITQNDSRALADLRRQTSIPLAGGQNEGLAWRFRQFLVDGALDVLQPNVVITGGYTQCVKIAGMAQAFNAQIDNGGAWPHYNMHLHAGLANGGMAEYHHVAVATCNQLFRDLPVSENGWLQLPEGPGLGFEPDRDAIREIARRPTSHGAGKAG